MTTTIHVHHHPLLKSFSINKLLKRANIMSTVIHLQPTSNPLPTDRSRTARDGRFPSQVDRWGLNHAPEESLTYKNFSFLYKFKVAIGGHRSKPDVFPIVTTALTTNSAGGGSQALKVLVAWTSPFLPSTFFPSCLEKQIMMGPFSSFDFSPSAPGVREYFPQGEC